MKFFTTKFQAKQGHLGITNLEGNIRRREGGLDFFKLGNRVLAVLCGGIFIYSMVKMTAVPVASGGGEFGKKIDEEKIVKEFLLPPRQSFDFYQNGMSGRDIFKSLWEASSNVETAPQLQPVPPSEFSVDANPPPLQEQLKVVGIVLGDVPEAIVEDLQTHETVFLKNGERLGEALVDDIQKDKVIFVYSNQKVEMAP